MPTRAPQVTSNGKCTPTYTWEKETNTAQEIATGHTHFATFPKVIALNMPIEK